MSVNQASTSADLLALRARESVRPIVMNLLGVCMPDFVRIARCIEVGLVEPMATIIESAAAFAQRCNELTPDGSLLRDLAAQQIVMFRAALRSPLQPMLRSTGLARPCSEQQ